MLWRIGHNRNLSPIGVFPESFAIGSEAEDIGYLPIFSLQDGKRVRHVLVEKSNGLSVRVHEPSLAMLVLVEPPFDGPPVSYCIIGACECRAAALIFCLKCGIRAEIDVGRVERRHDIPFVVGLLSTVD